MKITLSNRVLAVILVFALMLSAVNTYLIFDLRRALEGAANDSPYDYVIFQDEGVYKAKNQATSSVDFTSADAAVVITQAVAKGHTVYIQSGNYTLRSDVQIYNKKNAQIVGASGTVIVCNESKIIVKGDTYAVSQNNLVSGLTVVNGTLRIENSFEIAVSNMMFLNCSTALEVANTETWSEGTTIEGCRFTYCRESIVFKKPIGDATGSYASSKISSCFFNIIDDSVGILVEEDAEFSDSQFQNSRLWMGENEFKRNQTGLQVDGSMHQTLLSSVVFESFADYPDQLYAIALGETSVTPPTFAGGISFLGNWTAKVHNPSGRWISGVGAVFKQENLNVPMGLDGQYEAAYQFHMQPNTISSFKPEINLEGNFKENERVTVRFRLEFLDNTFSLVEKAFTNSTSMWLGDDDMLQLFPSQSVIWAILIDAKSSSTLTDVTVQVSLYGVTT